MQTSSVVRVGVVSLGLVALLGCRPVLVNVPEPGHGVVDRGVSHIPEISDDGTVVAFQTSDYLTTEDQDGTWDIYIRDVKARDTQLMSVSPGAVQDGCGANNPAMSGDGRYVSWAACMGYADVPPPPGTIGSDLYVKDRLTGALDHIGTPEELDLPAGGFGLLDDDASHIVMWCFPHPRNVVQVSVCIQDRRTQDTTVVSRRNDGQIMTGFPVPTSISDDGDLVAFTAAVSDVVPGTTDGRTQLFVRDVGAGVTSEVTIDPAVLPGDLDGRISGDGTAAVVWQTAPPYHVAHKDLVTGVVRRVDRTRCADAAPSPTYTSASVSDDGDVVAFHSGSAGLVPHDTNGHEDVFVWRTALPCAIQRVSVDLLLRQGDGNSYWPAVSGDGSTVAFVSEATNFPVDPTPGADAFVVRIGPHRH